MIFAPQISVVGPNQNESTLDPGHVDIIDGRLCDRDFHIIWLVGKMCGGPT